jgi:hypothetical protein
MTITEDQIADKKIAGTAGEGNPVLYIVSKGGLHAFFVKKNGQIQSLGAAPHKAIAMWLAEKRDPDVKWNKEFLSKSEYERLDLAKSVARRFTEIRNMFFGEVCKSEGNSDDYLVYDSFSRQFMSMTKAEIIAGVKSGTLDKFAMVRPADLSAPVSLAQEIG